MTTTTEVRWIGPDPGDIIELSSKLRDRTLFAAKYLADAIIDGKDESLIQSEREHYERTRAGARRVNELYERLYHSGASGRFAGYLVRDELMVPA